MIGFPIVGHQCAYGNEILGMVMSKILSKKPLTETQSRYRGVLRTLSNIYDDSNSNYSTKSSILDLWKVLIAEKTLHKHLKRRMLNSKLFGKLLALRAKWQSPTFFFWIL